MRFTILLLIPLLCVAGCKKKLMVFTAPEFSVNLPAEPRKLAGTREIPGYGDAPFTEYKCSDRGISYTVTILEVKPKGNESEAVIQDRTYAAMESAMPSVGANVTTSRIVILNGHRGREWIATVPELKNGHLWSRAFVIGPRLYQITVIAPGNVKGAEEQATTFLDSFKLLK